VVKPSSRRLIAGIVRHAVRKVAASRRKFYGEILLAQEWRPAMAAVLLMADEGKYPIWPRGIKRVITWPGLTDYSLCLNLRQIGIAAKPDDPAIKRCVDDA
jgi:hypothetical protein